MHYSGFLSPPSYGSSTKVSGPCLLWNVPTRAISVVVSSTSERCVSGLSVTTWDVSRLSEKPLSTLGSGRVSLPTCFTGSSLVYSRSLIWLGTFEI